MSRAAHLLETLHAAGARVQRDGQKLHLIETAGRELPPELIKAARAHKAEILRALDTTQAPGESTVEFSAGAAYDAAEAETWARSQYERNEVTRAQCDALLSFARGSPPCVPL